MKTLVPRVFSASFARRTGPLQTCASRNEAKELTGAAQPFLEKKRSILFSFVTRDRKRQKPASRKIDIATKIQSQKWHSDLAAMINIPRGMLEKRTALPGAAREAAAVQLIAR